MRQWSISKKLFVGFSGIVLDRDRDGRGRLSAASTLNSQVDRLAGVRSFAPAGSRSALLVADLKARERRSSSPRPGRTRP